MQVWETWEYARLKRLYLFTWKCSEEKKVLGGQGFGFDPFFVIVDTGVDARNTRISTAFAERDDSDDSPLTVWLLVH